MKVPAALLTLLAATQATQAADFAARVAAGRATAPSKEASEYRNSVMGNIVVPILRICAPPGSNTSAQDWVLTVVGTISASGKIEDPDAQPSNSITTCVLERLSRIAPLLPPAGIVRDGGFPLLVEIKMASGSKAPPSNTVAATPVFDQLVAFITPAGFERAFASTSATHFISEFVQTGESVEQWSQMITLSGAKGQAVDPGFKAPQYAEKIAAQFQSACPATFAVAWLGNLKISGHDAFVALAGCGTVESGPPRSEVAIVVAIRGKSDMYTLQWAERSAPSTQRPRLDAEKWGARLREMSPLKVCDPVAGELPPYPTCINSPSAP
jgi:hypothetical protein